MEWLAAVNLYRYAEVFRGRDIKGVDLASLDKEKLTVRAESREAGCLHNDDGRDRQQEGVKCKSPRGALCCRLTQMGVEGRSFVHSPPSSPDGAFSP